MAAGRDDFVIAFRSAFLKKKDKQKFSLLTLIFLSIFVIILTMFLLNKQTEIDQESKKSERVFDEKVKIYQKSELLPMLLKILVELPC